MCNDVYEFKVSKSDRPAIVDADDEWIVRRFPWHMMGGYVVTRTHIIGSKKAYDRRLHRLIMGVSDPKIYVDHVNGDTMDNRRCNLRVCINQQNQRNRTRLSVKNKSGYTGVCRQGAKWLAYYHIGGKNMRIGLYATAEEAAEARRATVAVVYGEFAPQVGSPTQIESK